ncbi:MAG: threonine synthase [Candidatus Spechtbacteria bacterium]|nr:threonine synthase [Candidatus Spechtbacteria bacterium]
MKEWKGILREFQEFLPVTEKTPITTLGEGNTPLVLVNGLAQAIGFHGKLYLKNEGANAGTNSFKDRGMTVTVSKALEEDAKAIICASTGNTLAAAAAYAAAAQNAGMKLRCIGILPEQKVAAGKLSQALRFGAKVIRVRGSFDAALEVARYLAKNYPVTLVNSINPYRIEGQKTAAFEIWEQLGGRPPDYHFIPVGNGGNITAYWKGYREYKENWNRMAEGYKKLAPKMGVFEPMDPVQFLPKMMGYQAAGAAPIVRGERIERPKTFASAIRIGNPTFWNEAVAASSESGGKIDMVTDGEIRKAYDLIPELTGIFCEPASAACVAGLIKALQNEEMENTSDTVVVCTLTGNGLKDPTSARRGMSEPILFGADPGKIARFLQLV